MTFPPQRPQPFERAAVAALRAGVLGCYGLFRRERWVYIGTGDIRAGLLAHLDGDRPWSANGSLADEPTHWVAVETPEYDAVARDLVVACGPLSSAVTRSPISPSGGFS